MILRFSRRLTTRKDIRDGEVQSTKTTATVKSINLGKLEVQQRFNDMYVSAKREDEKSWLYTPGWLEVQRAYTPPLFAQTPLPPPLPLPPPF